MQVNPGDGSGLVDEINDICQTDNNSFPIASKIRRLNAGLDRFYSLVFKFLNWTFDDSNFATNTDLTATINLVAGTQSYAFPAEVLTLKAVGVKETNGDYKLLAEEFDPQNTFLEPTGSSGNPTKFKLVGGRILLDYIPSTNVTAGLKYFFTRNAERFVTTDTTKEPGIPSIFHPWLAYFASLPYLIEFQKGQKNDVAALIQQGEESIKEFMANRNQTRKPRLGISLEVDNR